MTREVFVQRSRQHGDLRPEVEHILDLVGLSQHIPEIRRIAERLTSGDVSTIEDLTTIDRTIPGLGFVDVNERTSTGCPAGVYQIPDRPIFRGIQYVGMDLQMCPIEWLSRKIVIDSCYHLENSLKRRLGIREDQRYSIGVILSTKNGKQLEGSMRKPLIILNQAVYNRAKHTIEAIELDSHMFSVADAIAVYLCCRVIGARLIAKLGLKTRNGVPIFPQMEPDKECGKVQHDAGEAADYVIDGSEVTV